MDENTRTLYRITIDSSGYHVDTVQASLALDKINYFVGNMYVQKRDCYRKDYPYVVPIHNRFGSENINSKQYNSTHVYVAFSEIEPNEAIKIKFIETIKNINNFMVKEQEEKLEKERNRYNDLINRRDSFLSILNEIEEPVAEAYENEM